MEKNLGHWLKTERESKGLSLHEIGIQLKIGAKILQAIEETDKNKLPAKTFLRGFVRSYAQFLKLDVQEALTLFQSEYGTTHPSIPAQGSSANSSSAPIETPPGPVSAAGLNSTASGGSSEGSQDFSSSKNGPGEEKKASATGIESLSNRGSKEANREASLKTASGGSSANSNTPLLGKRDSDLSGNRILITLGLVALVSLIVVVSKLIDKYRKEQVVTQTQVAGSSGEAGLDKSDLSDDADDLGAGKSPAYENLSPDPLAAGGNGTAASGTTNSTSASTPVGGPANPSVIATSPATAAAVATTPSPTGVSNSSSAASSSPAAPASSGTGVKPGANANNVTSASGNSGVSGGPAMTTSSSTSPSAGSPASTPAAKTGLPTEVILEGLGSVKVEYDLGNGKKDFVDLDKGSFHTLRSKAGITLNVSDGSQVLVYLNGKLRGRAGPKGQPAQLKYSPQQSGVSSTSTNSTTPSSTP